MFPRDTLERRARGDMPGWVNRLAWEAVKAPGGKVEAYRVAAGWAERAVQLAPWHANYVNTLGVAQYRAGRWKEAVVTLERAAAMRKSPSPEDLLFLAMAHQRLGNVEAARDALERLRTEMKKPDNANDEDLMGFRREAEALIAGGAKR